MFLIRNTVFSYGKSSQVAYVEELEEACFLL